MKPNYPTLLLISTILLFDSFSALGQTTDFKKYTNLTDKFSFDIPTSWTIKYSSNQDGIKCIPVTPLEKEKYSDCFEGIVFRVDIFKLPLDSFLISDGYIKMNGDYYTSDRVLNNVKADNIKGSNWKGIYHNNICGITCKDTGFHAAAGQCQLIYFSNDRITVLVYTNGKQFDEYVLKRLINSFTFIK